MIIRRTFLRAALALPLMAVLPGMLRAQTPDDAQQFVATLTERAIASVADRQLSQDERNSRFRQLFVSSFDIPEIGRFVLSRYWRVATAEQQQEFLNLFEAITVFTWAKRIQVYNGERLDTLSATKTEDRAWMVDLRVLRPQGPFRCNGTFPGEQTAPSALSTSLSKASAWTSPNARILHRPCVPNGGQVEALLSSMRTKLDQLRAAG